MVHTLPTGIRRFAALVIMLCGVNQPANAFGFEKPSSTAEQIQLATAVLSLPLSIAAQEHPDSQALACLEHAVKAVNEFVACGNTNAFYNGPWFLYDTYKTVERLVALTISSPDTNQDELDNDDITQAEAESITDGQTTGDTPTTDVGQKHIKHIATSVLTGTEGVLRILTALCNNPGESAVEKEFIVWRNALLSNLCSLARTANNSLTADKKYRAYAQALLYANLVALYFTYHGYQGAAQLFEAEQQRETAILNRLHRLQADKKPTLETDDVITVFEAFWINKKSENYLIEENRFPDDIDDFCRQNTVPPIFTRLENGVTNNTIKDSFNHFMPLVRRWIRNEQQKNSEKPIPLEAINMPLHKYDAQGFHQVFSDWNTQTHEQTPGLASRATPTNGSATPQQPPQPNQLTEAECLQILGLTTEATPHDIRHRFRQLSLTIHPDKKKADEKEAATNHFRRISDAYQQLSTMVRTPRPTTTTSTTPIVTQTPAQSGKTLTQTPALNDMD